MKKLKLYLDTSAIGYLDEKSSPKEMNDMLTLWKQIKQGRYDVVVSQVTLGELSSNLNTDKVKVLFEFLSDIVYDTVDVDTEAEKVAALVKTNGLLISDKCEADRLHIGCAVVHNCDVLVSFNFKHLVNVQTIKGVRAISNLCGYGNIDIMPAVMLIEKGDDPNDSGGSQGG